MAAASTQHTITFQSVSAQETTALGATLPAYMFFNRCATFSYGEIAKGLYWYR